MFKVILMSIALIGGSFLIAPAIHLIDPDIPQRVEVTLQTTLGLMWGVPWGIAIYRALIDNWRGGE